MYLNFVCRASKRRKGGLCPLELSIILDNERKVITLERQINPQDFNPHKQRVRKDDATNEFIDSVRNQFFSIETEMRRRNMPMTIANMVDVFYHGFAETKITILALFDRHNNEAKEKAAQGVIVEATYKKYLLTRKYLATFFQEKLNKQDIYLVDITPAMIEQFYVYLNGFMDRNTSIHKMKLLKKILKIAQDEGYIRAMPFKLKLVSESLSYDTLTVNEIRAMRKKEFDSQRLTQVRDVFVFACYSGLAFTDLKNLTKNDLYMDEQGKEWIIKSRQKTKVISHIPLLPIAKEIWERYNYHLPVLSNEKYNCYLKEIANLCGIKKTLHTHLARHTFATILLNSGVDMVSVSKILGHSNSRITEKTYAKLMPETIMKRVEDVANQLI